MPHASSYRGVTGALLSAAALIGVETLLFLPVLVSGSIIQDSYQDLSRQDFFWRWIAHQGIVDSGRAPSWNPYLFGGMPLLGNIQATVATGMFDPFSRLMMAVEPGRALAWLVYLYIVAGGLFTFLFCLALGVRPAFGFLGGLYFLWVLPGTGPNTLALLAPISLTPLLFCLSEMWVRKRSAVRLLLLALVAGYHVSSGGPPFTYPAWLAVFAFAALRGWQKERGEGARGVLPAIRALVFAATPLAAGLLLAAPELLPFAQITSRSQRFILRGFGGSMLDGALSPSYLYTGALGLGSGTPLGAAVLVLVTVALLPGRRPVSSALWWIVAPLILIAFGDYLPFYSLARRLIPGLQMLREPYRFLLIAAAPLGALVALGAERLVQEELPGRRRLSRAWLIVGSSLAGVELLVACKPLGLALARAVYRLAPHSKPFAYHQEAVGTLLREMALGIPVVLAALAVGIFLGSPSLRVRLARHPTVVFLAAVALVLLSRIPPPTPVAAAPREWLAPRPWIRELSGLVGEKTRLLNLGGERIVPQSLSVQVGLRLADGYDPLLPDRYAKVADLAFDVRDTKPGTKLAATDLSLDALRHPWLLDLLGIGFILDRKEVRGTDHPLMRAWTNVATLQQRRGEVVEPVVYLYKNPDVLPYAYWIGSSREVGGSTERVLETLLEVDPHREVLVEGGPTISVSEEGRSQEVTVVRSRAGRALLEVETAKPGWVVLCEAFYPGWQARVDGRLTRILRANGVYQAVQVGAGRHRIEWTYTTPLFSAGVGVGLATLLALLLAMAASRFVPARAGRHEPGDAPP